MNAPLGPFHEIEDVPAGAVAAVRVTVYCTLEGGVVARGLVDELISDDELLRTLLLAASQTVMEMARKVGINAEGRTTAEGGPR